MSFRIGLAVEEYVVDAAGMGVEEYSSRHDIEAVKARLMDMNTKVESGLFRSRLDEMFSPLELWFFGTAPIGELSATSDLGGTRAVSFAVVIDPDSDMGISELVAYWVTLDAKDGTPAQIAEVRASAKATGSCWIYAAEGSGRRINEYHIFPSENLDHVQGYYEELRDRNERALHSLAFGQQIDCYLGEGFILVGKDHPREMFDKLIGFYTLTKKRDLFAPGGLGQAIYETRVGNAEHQRLLENVFNNFQTPRYLKFI